MYQVIKFKISFMGKGLTKVIGGFGYTTLQRYTGFYSISHFVCIYFPIRGLYYLECLSILIFLKPDRISGKVKTSNYPMV